MGNPLFFLAKIQFAIYLKNDFFQYNKEEYIMMMPENYEIRQNGKLVIIVNEVEYEFNENEDFIYSDKKKIILKHHAVINLASNANIKVGPPILLSSHDYNCFVFSREAVCSDGFRFYAIGEANGLKDNLWSEYLQQYPAETADNRAYERAVLGALGLYGKVYGGSEIPFADECKADNFEKDTSDNNQDAESEEVQKEIQTDETIHNAEISSELPKWWNDIGTGLYTDKQLDPETFIVTQGQCKGKNWTVKYLYDFNYKSCWYFATRDLDNAPSEEFTKQVFSCRRAIRKYGIKEAKAV